MDALDCYATNGTCSHIIIDDQTTLNLCDTIELNGDHSGLHITIDGTLKWYGASSGSICFLPEMITIGGTAHDIVIGGSGSGARSITTNYTLCQEWHNPTGGTCDDQICDVPSGGVISPPKAIAIRGSAYNITISNLNVSQVSFAIEVASSSVHTISVDNLNMQNVRYGVYASCDYGVSINGCQVTDAYGAHGYRFYADTVSVTNSGAENTDGTALWMVLGRDFTLDEFQSVGNRIRIGPDHASTSNVESSGGTGNEHISVKLGLIGAWFDEITTVDGISVGLGTVGSTARP